MIIDGLCTVVNIGVSVARRMEPNRVKDVRDMLDRIWTATDNELNKYAHQLSDLMTDGTTFWLLSFVVSGFHVQMGW